MSVTNNNLNNGSIEDALKKDSTINNLSREDLDDLDNIITYLKYLLTVDNMFLGLAYPKVISDTLIDYLSSRGLYSFSEDDKTFISFEEIKVDYFFVKEYLVNEFSADLFNPLPIEVKLKVHLMSLQISFIISKMLDISLANPLQEPILVLSNDFFNHTFDFLESEDIAVTQIDDSTYEYSLNTSLATEDEFNCLKEEKLLKISIGTQVRILIIIQQLFLLGKMLLDFDIHLNDDFIEYNISSFPDTEFTKNQYEDIRYSNSNDLNQIFNINDDEFVDSDDEDQDFIVYKNAKNIVYVTNIFLDSSEQPTIAFQVSGYIYPEVIDYFNFLGFSINSINEDSYLIYQDISSKSLN